ncbi:MMPL family transporter [Luteipulveratus flavus]|uniref:MMPL family transporter n=1 Tax=Luteipulveratus flavus TaxID=3031728 RepID=A0ABT6C521_9MICO|nr:MMPL family transporter [Luteipulveratus sp. YIM 133296]MDF8264029.1 MMPL family transporter [Luteipulveratus sp. YIM 133296]
MSHSYAHIVCGRRSKWVVAAIWVVLFLGLGPLAGKLADAQDNQASSWLPASAESTKAFDQLGAFIDKDSMPALVVYERPSGITATDLSKATADASAFAKTKGLVGKVVGPVPSQDKKALQTIVPLHIDPKTGWNDLPDIAKGLKATATKDSGGMAVHVGGPVGFGADQATAFGSLDKTLLLATLGVVVLILLLTYRSPVLWVLPIACAFAALVAAQAMIYLLAEHAGLTVNGQSYGILTVLVIGAGTDYALLLIARYREELRRHEDRHEAMALALHRSGPAILASGSTVILGMLCLLVAEMNSTKSLGPVAALGVVFSLVSMLTLLPALLVIFGRWMFWPRRPSFGSREPTESGLWARVGGFIKVRPRPVWVVTGAALLLCALGLVKLNANGLSTDETFVNTEDSVVASKVLEQHFPTNAGDPVYVLVDADKATTTVSALRSDAGVQTLGPPQVRGDRALVQAAVAGDAYSQKAFDTVEDVRRVVHGIDGSNALVGGSSATTLDIHDASAHDNRVIIPLTLLVVMIVLGGLLRAIVAPVVLIATVVLSFAAALGLSSLVFHYVFGFGGTDQSLPLFVFVFLVALGIDYNIFLMTRVREEAQQHGTRRGALVGLAATGGVITSAGIVLAATFAVLGTIPVVAFAEIGFAVALGVLLDTIVVRAVLVTALNLDIGNKIWWPGRLSTVPDEAPVAEHLAPAAVARAHE